MNPKESKKQYDRARYLSMRGAILARNREWKRNNREKVKAANQLWYSSNRTKVLAQCRAWCLANPSAASARTMRYLAKRRGLIHRSANAEKIAEVYKRANQLGWTVDHIIPLSCGGWHHESNLQPLPLSINSSKNNDPFWEAYGFLCWRDVPEFLWPDNLKHKYLELKN